MNKTKIPWCDYTWNPIVGCSRISEGCINCYAEAIAKRFNQPWGHPVFMPERLGQPAKQKTPSRIFVCSVSDIGHEEVKREWLYGIYDSMRMAPWHQYILLTKRPGNIEYPLVPHFAWIGVTVESQSQIMRWEHLRLHWAGVAFASVEPMLGPVSFYSSAGTSYPDWVIAGPENGPRARPCKDEWIESLATESACFFDKRENFTRREFPKLNPTENRTVHKVSGPVPPVILPPDSDNQSERK